jgi:hypothetical protein
MQNWLYILSVTFSLQALVIAFAIGLGLNELRYGRFLMMLQVIGYATMAAISYSEASGGVL